MRIVGQIRKSSAQRVDCMSDRLLIRLDSRCERQPMTCMSRAANQLYAQCSLRHRAGLADPAAIHPYEIRLLGGEPGGVALAPLDRVIECRGERIEIVFHVHAHSWRLIDPFGPTAGPNGRAMITW